MRYLFVVTGIGYGHSTRDISVINEIKKRDKNARFVIAGYLCSYKFFKKKKFEVVRLEGEDFSGENFKLRVIGVIKKNLDLPIKWTKDVLTLVETIRKFRPDYVVVDWEPVGIIASALTKTKSVLIFNYNPNNFRRFVTRFKVSKSRAIQHRVISRIYTLSERYSKAIFVPFVKKGRKGKFHFIDFIIRQKPESLPTCDALLKKLGLLRKPILVMLGGSKYGDALLDRMLKFLYLYDEDFLIFGYDKIFRNKNVRSLSFRDNFLEYLKVSKGVITLAGHSTFEECAIFKKPCLVFPIIEHMEQMLNAFDMEKVGFVRVCYLKELNENKISKDIKFFVENIDGLSRKAQKFNVKGDGASQIAEFLLKG